MILRILTAVGAAVILLAALPAGSAGQTTLAAKNDHHLMVVTTTPQTVNPLLQEWDGPYGGVPPFDKVRVADFQPALEAGMAEMLSEIEEIENKSEAPTFENTIAEMERDAQSLNSVRKIHRNSRS